MLTKNANEIEELKKKKKIKTGLPGRRLDYPCTCELADQGQAGQQQSWLDCSRW
jgi:hypothetical protein